jgi:hypothetical protein
VARGRGRALELCGGRGGGILGDQALDAEDGGAGVLG